jgi:hypothetical protein
MEISFFRIDKFAGCSPQSAIIVAEDEAFYVISASTDPGQFRRSCIGSGLGNESSVSEKELVFGKKLKL